ncbi:MAG: sensor histidine kinase [Labilithrix sp.]|nr:sensor histidine kinase [Labilithrix sp.]
MWRELRAHLREPASARPRRPSTLDAVLALAGIGLALLEGTTRDGLALRPLQIAVGVGMGATLRWRTTAPLPALLVAFALANLLTLVGNVLALPELGLSSSALVLLHVYSLLRHGSGREVAIGLGAVLATYVGAAVAGEMHGLKEGIGALVVLLFPAALGVAVRFRDIAHRRDVEHAQLRERQMLARELHDTVAHHVSAIVIQAQAARAVSSTRPDAAAAALLAIEGEALRSLAELRALVGALRDDDAAALTPQARAHAIEELVREAGARATFERAGDLEHLAPAVELALHRIARESLHNALQHARGATRIDVRLVAESDSVRLTVRDDGAASPARGRAGFGLIGMKERATLLGGSLEAGPMPAGGWQVLAVLPRGGARA